MALPQRAVTLRPQSLTGLGPWDLALFVQLPLVVTIVFLWQIMSADGLLTDFDALRRAAQDVLAGASPYPPADAAVLAKSEQLVYPPLIAFLLAPFALVSGGLAEAFYVVILIVALPITVAVLGVRDRRLFFVGLLWPSMVAVFGVGALGPLLALGLALAWRWRNALKLVAPLVALVVVSKLFLWPILIWLLATRRFKAALAAVLIGAAATGAAWAAIGFTGLREYPELLRTLTALFEPMAYSTSALALSLGAPTAVARLLLVLLAIVAIVAIIRLARRDDGDRRSFILAIGAALLLSPILWLHYLVLLLVPFALVRPKLSLLWLSPLVLWVTPHYAAAGDIWRIVVVLGFIAVAFSVALRASPGPRLSAR